VRPLYLRQGERTLSLMVPWPPLLLAARERTLYVVALRGGRRPTARTPLYHAPLMNVHATGQVCTGNADLPAETTLATLAAWQAVLTDTWFTHVNHPNTLRLPDSTGMAVDTRRYLRFWRDLAKRRAERFPVACLTPLGLTLEGFLRRLTRS